MKPLTSINTTNSINANNPMNTSNTRLIISLSAILLSLGVAYYPVLRNVILAWHQNEEYSHGFLIAPIAAYLIWSKRNRLKSLFCKPSNIALPIMVFGIFTYVIGFYAEIRTVTFISLLINLFGISLFIFGTQITREIAFPLFFLAFMFPVPSRLYAELTVPLQLLVTRLSAGIVGLGGIPIHTEGNIITLPDVTLQVVNACSGLRSLISLMALSLIFGYLSVRSNTKRILLALSALPIAIIVNTLRVSLAAVLSMSYGPRVTEGSFHTIFGLSVFIVALLLLTMVQKLLLRLSPEES